MSDGYNMTEFVLARAVKVVLESKCEAKLEVVYGTASHINKVPYYVVVHREASEAVHNSATMTVSLDIGIVVAMNTDMSVYEGMVAGVMDVIYNDDFMGWINDGNARLVCQQVKRGSRRTLVDDEKGLMYTLQTITCLCSMDG